MDDRPSVRLSRKRIGDRVAEVHFENRATHIDPDPVALRSSFAADEKTEMQWKAFVKRMRIEHDPGSLDEIRKPLRQFLIPIAEALAAGETFETKWIAPGGWQ